MVFAKSFVVEDYDSKEEGVFEVVFKSVEGKEGGSARGANGGESVVEIDGCSLE